MDDKQQYLKRIKAKRKAKRDAKLAEMEGGGSLNLNSMMDMMTIILVFLLKSYGSEPLSVGADTDVPFSTAEKRPEATSVVAISEKAIFVGPKKALELNAEHRVDDSEKKGGPTSMIITKLEDLLRKDVEIRKNKFKDDPNAAFKGKLTIIADNDIPYQTIAEVLQTAIVNEYKEFRFAVFKGGTIKASGTIAERKQ